MVIGTPHGLARAANATRHNDAETIALPAHAVIEETHCGTTW